MSAYMSVCMSMATRAGHCGIATHDYCSNAIAWNRSPCCCPTSNGDQLERCFRRPTTLPGFRLAFSIIYPSQITMAIPRALNHCVQVEGSDQMRYLQHRMQHCPQDEAVLATSRRLALQRRSAAAPAMHIRPLQVRALRQTCSELATRLCQ